MTDELVHLTRQDDGVAIVRLDRPKVNAMSIALLGELGDVARALHDDLPGAVVVTGGERAFAAGFEISEMPVGGDAGEVSRLFREALGALASLPRFVVAAVNGVALGGGLELALACDWRVLADNGRVGLPEVLLGVIPGAGGTQRLPRLVGPAKAKEMAMTGRQVGADEALAIGLVDEVVPAAEVQARALAKAAELAAGAVAAQGYIKTAIDEGVDTSLAWGLDREREFFLAVMGTDDARIGVASFLEHGPGKATFTGR
jgi:enoyl-CoA hydratase